MMSKKSISLLLAFSMILTMMTITAVNAESAAPLTVEFEAYDTARAVSNANASGGSLVKLSGVADGYSLSASFTAETTGYYNVLLYAACYPSSAWLSDLSFTVNNSPSVTLTTANSTATSPATAYLDGTFVIKYITYALPVRLVAGTNNLTVSMPLRRQGNDKVYGALDCVKFTPIELPTVSAAGGTVESEQFTAATTNENASGGGVTRLFRTDLSSYQLAVDFNAEAAGYYDMTVYAACDASFPIYMSPMTFSVNGGESVLLSEANCTITNPPVAYLDSSFVVKYFAYKIPVYLKQGGNAVIFDLSARKDKTGGILGVLDCIKFSPAEISALSQNGGRVEVEDNTVKPVVEDAAVSGGKYVFISGAAATQVDVLFDVAREGDYSLTFGAAANTTSEIGKYMSKLYLSCNDGAQAEIKANGTGKTAELTGDTMFLYNNAFEYGTYQYLTPLHFNTGINKISFYLPVRAQDSLAYGILDFIQLDKINDSDDLYAVAEEAMNVNSTQTITLYDADQALEIGDFYMVTFASSNEAVATVDGNGLITARRMGEAEITITVYPDYLSSGYVIHKSVYVVGDTGVYINSKKNNNGNISLSVKSNQAVASGRGVVIVANYTAIGGEKNQLEEIRVLPLPGMTGGDAIPLTTELSSYAAGDLVSVFVWESLNSPAPIYAGVIIE